MLRSVDHELSATMYFGQLADGPAGSLCGVALWGSKSPQPSTSLARSHFGFNMLCSDKAAWGVHN